MDRQQTSKTSLMQLPICSSRDLTPARDTAIAIRRQGVAFST